MTPPLPPHRAKAVANKPAEAAASDLLTTTPSKSGLGLRGSDPNKIHTVYMPLYRITVRRRKNSNGILLEAGMSVEVLSKYFYNPLTTNGGQIVADAFMRIYGVDLKRAGALNTVDLDVEKIG